MGITNGKNRYSRQRLVRVSHPGGKFAAALSIFLYLLLPAANPSSLGADEIEIVPGIERSGAAPGETVRMKLLIPDAEAGNIRVGRETFPEGIVVERGPFVRPRIPEGGAVIEYDLSGRMPGRYLLGPFRAVQASAAAGPAGAPDFGRPGEGRAEVTVFIGSDAGTGAYRQVPAELAETGGQTADIQGLAFFVSGKDGKAEGEGPAVPVSVFWKVSKQSVYLGSPVYLVLWGEMLRSEEPVFETSLGRTGSSVIEPTEVVPPRRPLRLENGTFYQVPLSAYLFTPFETGTVAVPEVTVRAEGTDNRAEPVFLEVLPFPGMEAGGAVGNFTFENKIINRKKNNKIILEQECRGRGNLPFFPLPEPQTAGLALLDREEDRSVVPMPEGYTGRKVRRSVYIYAGEGPVRTIVIPDMTVVDPDSGETKTVKGEEFAVDAPSAEVEDRETPEVPGPAGGEPAGISDAEVSEAVERLAEKDAAGLIYRYILEEISARRKEDFGPEEKYAGPAAGTLEKLYTLRRLHRRHPMDRELVRAIRQVEAENGIVHSLPVTVIPHPDIFAYGFFAALILAGVALLRGGRKGAGRKLLVIALVLLLGSGTVFGVLCSGLLAPECVVRETVRLLKIPAEDASGHQEIPEGTALKVDAEWKGFVQITGGSGVRGWLPLSAVLVY